VNIKPYRTITPKVVEEKPLIKTRALERLKKKLTIENLWMYIVSILTNTEPLKAYDIKKKLWEKYRIKPATVTVYTVVYKMTREGLIKTVKVSGETRYTVTDKGLEALKEAKEFIRKILEEL